MANQFNTQLGYFQGFLNAEIDFEIADKDTWTTVTPVITDDSNFQYNTSLDSNTIVLEQKGIWRIDVIATFQGSTNDDMRFTAYTSESGNLPEMKWNARGGNNWAISYSAIYKFKNENAVSFKMQNNEAAGETITMSFGIFTAIRLY
tara:strand:- start:1028 stop:1468 length:441 start_codon:yes stop_codon:yes gene_type:complete